MHYWSLALEEQFYLVFPLLLYFLMLTKRHLLRYMLILCAISYGACVAMTPFAPVAAFYLLPTRAWELLAGSALIIAPNRYRDELPYGIPIGLAVLALSFVVVRAAGFPGWIAVLPVAGTAAVLVGIQSPRGAAHRLLAHPFMVFVGRRSYSLYLWHWPAFSLVDYHFFSSSLLLRLCLKAVMTIGGTLLTYRFVEKPMRQWLSGHRLMAFGGFAVAATLLAIVGYDIRSTHYLTAAPADVATGGIAINPRGHGSVVLMGDSEGAMYGYELASLARELNFRLNVVSVAGGKELPGEPGTHRPNVMRFLEGHKPDAIILAQAWSSKPGNDGRGSFEQALPLLTKRTNHLVVLTKPPVPPTEARREAIRAGARPPFFEGRLDAENRLRASMAVQRFGIDKLQVLDVAPYLLEGDRSIRMIGSDGRLTFQDKYHLSDSGTAFVRPALETVLRQVLKLPLSPAR